MKPISRTAFACCGIRMLDAESERSICGDRYASRFMDTEEGQRVLAAFTGMERADRSSASNVARHRIIDDLLRRELSGSRHPLPSLPPQGGGSGRGVRELLVVTIGAGFDSRPYRLPGGTWVELDEPAVLSFKDERLPVSECMNALSRIAIDFSCESLEEKLAPWSRPPPVVIVVEGVLMYLDEAQIRGLIASLGTVFPQHTLICELITRRFVETYGKAAHETIQRLGATFKYAVDRPEELFLRGGYRLRERLSIGARAVELGAMTMPFGIPRFLARALKPLMRNAVNGYTVCVFDKGA